MADFNEILNRPTAALSAAESYVVDVVVPNCGPWNELHCLYGLTPKSNENEVVYIVLPRDPFWNYMARGSNLKIPISLPDSIQNFIEQDLEIFDRKLRTYIHIALL